jgi:hypothetical protein
VTYNKANIATESPCANAPKGGSLDTLAQSGKNGRQTLAKRARSKYALQPLLLALIDEAKEEGNEDMLSSYWQSYHCAGVLEQEGQQLKGRYCNQRWCLVCSRIRTAKLMNKYTKHLNTLPEPHFVTLTAPTVTADALPIRIKEMGMQAKQIRDVMKKRGTPLIGIRKIEVTYNAEQDRFHPHYHFMLSGQYEAEVLRSEWLKRNPTASDKAQDVKEADENTLMEVFKYTAKHCSKGKRSMNAPALHIIYKALRGVRTFQSLGGWGAGSDVSDEGEEMELDAKEHSFLNYEKREWIWEGHDWKSKGEDLTGYEPSEAIEKFRTSIETWNADNAEGNSPPQTTDKSIVQTLADRERLRRAETILETILETQEVTQQVTEEMQI